MRSKGTVETRAARVRLAKLMGVVIAGWAILATLPTAVAAERNASAPQPVAADRPTSAAQPQPAPSELVREGMEKMLQALDAMVQSVPQYQMPEIAPNGDIIIRRKWPEKAPAEPQQKPTQPGPVVRPQGSEI